MTTDTIGGRPLGRLFWKVFVASWAALTVASLAVGGLVWLSHAQQRAQSRGVDEGPTGQMLVDAAAIVAKRAGRAGLAELIVQSSRPGGPPHPSLFAVDANGVDLLGRPVPADSLSAARAALGREHVAVRQLAVDGTELLLFVPGPPRRAGLGGLPPLPDDGAMPSRATSAPAAGAGSEPPKFGPDRPSPAESWLHPLYAPLATGLIASALLAALLAWYFAGPIRALSWAFGRAARGDLTARVAPRVGNRRDEIADLGRRFDAMVQQLDDLMQTQRRLFHDVSHELRSPLARMQVCVGLARRDPVQTEGMLDRIEQEAEKMSALIGEVLTLARLDAGIDLSREKELTEMAALLADLVDEARIEAGAKGVTISLSARRFLLDAQPQLLRRAFGNVLRNAVQHAPAGSQVDVDAGEDGPGRCRITVADRGPGLSDEDLVSVFQPFVRGHGRVSEGFGLGLAIAHRAVQAHGGRIEAARREGGGLVITIVLPR
jgi:two-component system OmpR family sensor kinase